METFSPSGASLVLLTPSDDELQVPAMAGTWSS
jgi:hypothetical protein